MEEKFYLNIAINNLRASIHASIMESKLPSAIVSSILSEIYGIYSIRASQELAAEIEQKKKDEEVKEKE